MKEPHIYPISPRIAKQAYIDHDQYQRLYQASIQNPEMFWADQAKQFISWFQPWNQVLSGSFNELPPRWFIGATLNASYNCLDRHLEKKGEHIALLWQADNPEQKRSLSYRQLHAEVCRFANVLKTYGARKGDRICIYMPMIPEVVIAMLACARIGAVHSVVFAGFSAESLRTRISDANCTLVITADEGMRGGKFVPLKQNVDEALTTCPQVKNVIVFKHSQRNVPWNEARDIDYHQAMAKADRECEPEIMDAEDPLFILYTSGSTGKPKGVVHSHGGYLVYTAITFKYVFDYHEHEIYWCTADVGWITGHSYVVYGPLINGATTLLFEGVPSYPTFSRFWEIIDNYQVNIFYTAPTAIRALRHEGDEWVTKTSRKSLTLLGTVGEPINPDVWEWYYQIVGESRCPIVDTWWQTETGGIMITPLPGATPLKPGSVAWPFFGIEPAIVNDQGQIINDEGNGKLLIKKPWPGMMQGIYGDPERFVAGYFAPFPGNYLTGDNAHRDAEGYYWVVGRDDDVIKVSGHRLSTAEIESALLADPQVSEAAVVPVPNDITGQAIYAFVSLKAGMSPSDNLKKELIALVRKTIGPIATIDQIQWTEALPKTRSGKIMRRILRKLASHETEDLGDLSTLANPEAIDEIVRNLLSVKCK